MATTNQNQVPDDGTAPGTNEAPANYGQSPNVFAPGQDQSNGQRGGRASWGNNRYDNNIRKHNPLSKFSSYTYCLTLYLVTPECSNYFAEFNKLPPNDSVETGRWFIVARSGGLNWQTDPRALTLDSDGVLGPGKPGLDYIIDDLNFDIFMLGADGQKTATAATQFNFKVTEPIGFTFLWRLIKASNQVNKLTALVGNIEESKKPNLYQQNYMVGIKFYGYDSEGNIIESSKIEDPNAAVMGDKYGIYERIFPLVLTKCNFTVNGKATVYNFEGVINNQQAAFGAKRGWIPTGVSLEGTTVGELLEGTGAKSKALFPALNEYQETLKVNKNITIPTVYEIDWSGFNEIKNSTIITSSDIDLKSTHMSNATSTEESNPETAKKSPANVAKKMINIGGNTTIASAIDQVIVRSAYVVEKLIKENNVRVEVETLPNNKGTLSWYAINPIAKIIKRDDLTNDWAYKLTYQIVPYEVPYVRSQYVNKKSKYYGAVKEYYYTFTGQNTEVLNFEMEYNNAFYVVTTPTTTPDDSARTQSQGKVTPVQPGVANSAITSGKVNNADVIANNVRANLYSIADQALATIKILGDPDFLMDSIGAKIQPSPTFGKFHSVNQTIAPYGGQIFVEIIFDVAEDYKESTGLLDLDPNSSIAFYPLEQQRITGSKGLIYKIKKVKSTFNKGKFEQVLELYMVPSPELVMQDTPVKDDYARSENEILARKGVQQNTAGNPNTSVTNAAANNSRQAVADETDPYFTFGAPNTGPDRNNTSNPLQKNPASSSTATGSTTSDDSNAGSSFRPSMNYGSSEGRESDSLINRARRFLGIPNGGTTPGGGG